MPTYNDPRNSDRNRITRANEAAAQALTPLSVQQRLEDRLRSDLDARIEEQNGGVSTSSTSSRPPAPGSVGDYMLKNPMQSVRNFFQTGSVLPQPTQDTAPSTTTALPTPPTLKLPSIDNPYANNAYEGTAKFLQERQAQIDEDYASRKAELMSRYNLAPTADERNRLSWMLAELEAQRAAASDAIQSAFGSAIKGNQQLGKQMARQGKKAARQTRRGFNRAGAAADATVSKANAVRGGLAALGLGQSGVSGGAVAAGGNLRSQGAINAADRRQIGADDRAMLNYFAQSLRGQQAAQIGDAQRLAAGLSAEAQAQWDAQVQARIQEERMAQMAALDALEAWKSQAAGDVAGRLADNQFDRSMYYADRRDARQDKEMNMQYEQDRQAYEDAYALAVANNAANIPLDFTGGPRPVQIGDNMTEVSPSRYRDHIAYWRAIKQSLRPDEIPGKRAEFAMDMRDAYNGDFEKFLAEQNTRLEDL